MAEQGKDVDRWVPAALVVVAVIVVAAISVPLRDEIDSTNVGLLLLLVVVIGAALGGRLAGVAGGVAAALSFNFFHSEPYYSLRIDSGTDVVTVVLLLVLGLVVGELSVLNRRSRAEVVDRAAGSHELESALALLNRGASVEEIWEQVRHGLGTTLGVTDATFEPLPGGPGRPHPPSASTAPDRVSAGVIEGDGRLDPPPTRWTGRGFELPEDVTIAVVSGGRLLGQVHLDPTPGRGVTRDDRRTAIALVDILGLAMREGGEARLPHPR